MSCSYFDAIDRISTAGYQATEQDILRSRVRTSGIVEESYMIDSVHFVYVGYASRACAVLEAVPVHVDHVGVGVGVGAVTSDPTSSFVLLLSHSPSYCLPGSTM